MEPIGRTVAFMSAPNLAMGAIGVAKDAHLQSLREPAPRMIYTPLVIAGMIRDVVRAVSPACVDLATRTISTTSSPHCDVSEKEDPVAGSPALRNRPVHSAPVDWHQHCYGCAGVPHDH